ncbi:hypothetical protein L1049_003102 [Liquidambar formosana]|uniref:Pentatricopeptide repeat-containing protein n=1 Tax=Liquidambar formosana TaxID=63359 RepID=A0AAP0NH06_LIQFO
MHGVLAKLCHYNSARVCFWNHHFHFCLLRNFRTISNSTNPIEGHPFEKYETNYNHCMKLHHLSYVLDDCTDSRDLFIGRLVHAHLIKVDFDGFISLWNKVISLYCKCGQIQGARLVFDTMAQRDVVSFNTMISTYVRCNYGALATVHLYSMMKEEDAKPNHITLAGLIGACDGLEYLQWRELFHAQAIQYGLNSNEFVGCSLVDGYAKQRKLEDAIRAFDEIVELDLVSWNIMIDACARNNSKEHALRIFSRMLQENVRFDGFTLTSMVKTCSEAKYLACGMQLHGCAIKTGLACETPICNSLITMYSKCAEGMTSATKIFGGILEPNIISWTAMIAGFMQNGQNEEAIGVYKKMLRLGVKENDFCFASILSVYINFANLENGRHIHGRIVKSWFELDLSVNNALIDMYSKCGSLEDAHLVFMRMAKHDVVSCTTMITGFGQHGKGREALEILEQMAREGLNPDDVTFLGCLSACSHGGLVDEGIKIFKIMRDVHNLKPRREHFACVVDMLGRAGRLNEAQRFIKEMAVESDVLVWEALIGACRLHGEMGLGEMVAKKIMELQPDRHGAYVLLANMYADGGLWEEKGVVREKLIVSGLKKEAGCSWVHRI